MLFENNDEVQAKLEHIEMLNETAIEKLKDVIKRLQDIEYITETWVEAHGKQNANTSSKKPGQITKKDSSKTEE